jgi:hypothetical protein
MCWQANVPVAFKLSGAVNICALRTSSLSLPISSKGHGVRSLPWWGTVSSPRRRDVSIVFKTLWRCRSMKLAYREYVSARLIRAVWRSRSVRKAYLQYKGAIFIKKW